MAILPINFIITEQGAINGKNISVAPERSKKTIQIVKETLASKGYIVKDTDFYDA